MRRAAKVDASQAEIVEALRKMGCTVQSLAKVGDGCPDLLVGYMYANILMEVKEPAVKGKLRRSQADWHKKWQGVVGVVQTPEEAIQLVRAITDEYD